MPFGTRREFGLTLAIVERGDPAMSATQVLDARCQSKVTGAFTIDTVLEYFALITYAVSPECVRHLIHPAFDLHPFEIDGQPRALLSVVPFLIGVPPRELRLPSP